MIRASQGLTQAEFAARLGFHKRSYIAWEQGYREMPGRALSRLRQEFNIVNRRGKGTHYRRGKGTHLFGLRAA